MRLKLFLLLQIQSLAITAHQSNTSTLQEPIELYIDDAIQNVSQKLTLLRKAFKKYSLLYPVSIETDIYGGHFITFSLSDKAKKILEELEIDTDIDLGWNGATIRTRIKKILDKTLKKTDIPSSILRGIQIITGTITLGDEDIDVDDSDEELMSQETEEQILQILIKYYDLSKRILNGSEAIQIFSIMQIPHSEYIAKALGFFKTSRTEEIREFFGEQKIVGVSKNSNIIDHKRVTQSATVPDIESLRSRILEVNRRIRESRKQVKGHKRPPNYYIALDIYASGKQVVGEKYILNFAERRALPIAALDRHPIVAEHDYSGHLRELLTITPELGEAFQALSQDVIKLINFLKRNYSGALDPFTRQPKLMETSKAFATGEDVIVAQCLNSIFKGMGKVLDTDLIKVTPKTLQEVDALIYNELIKEEVNIRIHSLIEISFDEIVDSFIGKEVTDLDSLGVLMDFESDGLNRSAVIENIKKSFYEKHPDLKNKKYLPEGKVFVDYFVDAQKQIQYLNEFLKENPL
jgi:hypothetical protein